MVACFHFKANVKFVRLKVQAAKKGISEKRFGRDKNSHFSGQQRLCSIFDKNK